MITVTLKWCVGFDLLKERGEESITLQPKATFRDFLDILSETIGDVFTERIYDSASKELRGDLCFILNGRIIDFLYGMESELKDGDRLHIVPIMGGG